MEKGKINNLFDYQIDKNILSYQTNKYKVGYLCIYLENAMDLFWFSNLLDNKKALKTFLICDLKKFSFWCFIFINKSYIMFISVKFYPKKSTISTTSKLTYLLPEY